MYCGLWSCRRLSTAATLAALSIMRSPTKRLARLNSYSRATTFGSSVRRFRAARSPSRNSSRQLDNTLVGRPVSRLRVYRLSPSSSRSTTSCLRFADQRFTDFMLMDTSCRSHSTTKYVSNNIRGTTQWEEIYFDFFNNLPNDFQTPFIDRDCI